MAVKTINDCTTAKGIECKMICDLKVGDHGLCHSTITEFAWREKGKP